MGDLGAYIVPGVITCILAAGLWRKQNVFDEFLDGAKDGISIAFSILPALVGLMTAIEMLNASGAFDWLCRSLSPLWQTLHMPGEVVPLALMRSVSGSGSLSLYQSILQAKGPDSLTGRIASVLEGSSETTFYTIAKTRHTLPAARAADVTGLVMSIITVRLFFG